MTKQRASLGFDTAAEWEVAAPPHPRPDAGSARKAAEATGFHSREAAPQRPAGQGGQAPVRRRRTGRNAQFNLKARPDTIQSFCDVADAKGWGLGETLEHAVALLQREYGPQDAK